MVVGIEEAEVRVEVLELVAKWEIEGISLNPGNTSSHPVIDDGDKARSDADRTTEKVRFKEGNGEQDIDMVVVSGSSLMISWKDKLLGVNPGATDNEKLESPSAVIDDELKFFEGDIQRSIVNGIPAIDFSERIQKILFKEMEVAVVIKLLGRNIGYGVLNNRINSLWNPIKPFHLIDIENRYYLVKFQSIDDYTKVLSQGPWMIYGQYLTVQPWTKDFNSSQPYPSIVLAWIRLPGLPGFLYKRKIIEEIGGTIGKVVRLDFNTDNRTRGRIQRVEYEALPTIYFTCGKYGYTKEICGLMKPISGREKVQTDGTSTEKGEEEQNIREEGKVADFQENFKAGDLKGKQKQIPRDSPILNRYMRLREDLMDAVPSILKSVDPIFNGIVGRKPAVGDLGLGAAGSSASKQIFNPLIINQLQVTKQAGPNAMDSDTMSTEPGSILTPI
ncbi:hypothetical protein GOBAR_AA32989 [Gossypium barbadense]|uniref:DUF4283 domain-containing protein n=1 Tax=Gossypium barbadense TaxID=3634 RepID=A0A2P5W9E1_GOSBA|nr:hypothetical protein GOBAR_AA32989 [Gossypium barbadense]